MVATPQLCGKEHIVNGYKTIQVASNGVTMRVFPGGNHPLLWQWILTLERADTVTQEKMTRLTCIVGMAHFEEPRAAD